MRAPQYFKSKIFHCTPEGFNALALELFQYQAQANPIYQAYIEHLGLRAQQVKRLEQIPHLPIQFFKSEAVTTRPTAEAALTFTSSGTTGAQTSRHFVFDLPFYQQNTQNIFERFYGPLQDFFVAGLLPSYLERSGSSLISMVQHFIGLSADEDSGFFLDELSALSQLLAAKKAAGKKILLIGVTFALLDLARDYPQDLSGAVLMETGGMKGRRKEMVRSQVHSLLQEAFNLEKIHSEYGMTELLSQAYSLGEGVFNTPPWVKVSVRQTDDPFSLAKPGKTGGLNIIDLANIESCAFIETQDLARLHPNGTFEVMGRFDTADIRGCNLLVV